MAQPYSDIEVVPGTGLEYYSKYDEGPQHYTKYEAGLERDNRRPIPNQKDLDSYKQTLIPHDRRICGLTLRTFWIITIVGIVLMIGGAVGGGVAGSQMARKKSSTEGASSISASPLQASSLSLASSSGTSQSTNSDKSTASTTPTRTSTPEVSLTTSQIIGPSVTLLRDCPSSNNTLYGITLGTINMNYRKICGMSYLNIRQGQDGEEVVNSRTSSLDSCINFCAAYNVQSATEIAAGNASVCNAVCWRNSLGSDNFPSQCFGYTTKNSSNAFVINEEDHCDSAAWVDQRIL
jgi:hypothetical protein